MVLEEQPEDLSTTELEEASLTEVGHDDFLTQEESIITSRCDSGYSLSAHLSR
jgi:hypothetical protein